MHSQDPQSNQPFVGKPERQTSAALNDNDARYKCCCGCCRATTGVIVLSLLDVLAVAGLISKIFGDFDFYVKNG